MTGHALHLSGSSKLTAVSRIVAESSTLSARLRAPRAAWKRTLLVGVMMAFGAFAGTGCASGGPGGASAIGGAGSDTTTPPPSGGFGSGGSSGESAALTLDTGRTVIRRLNRTEYTLTVRDLLGTSMKPLASLDAESATDFFDTIGEFLSISPLQVETMEAAASALTDELFALPETDTKRTKVLVCTPTPGDEATCARRILTTFARRAFRRPASTAEIDSLMALIDKVRAGGTYNDGLKAAITAVLLSPHFLYKEETSVGVAADAPPKLLNAFELATRLSYFLWSTMPDEALAASADAGKLVSNPAELAAEVDRMLADPKAETLSSNFARQWLSLSRLDPANVNINTTVYPGYNPALPASAQQETTTFFAHLISNNLPLSSLIDADFTYADALLAKHYGVMATGTSLTRVSLAGTPRAGLLTQTSFLMGNAHPDVSSPVQRGDWVLHRILCAATPPPPNNVDLSFERGPTGVTARDVLEGHRADPKCAGCHNIIDPLGLGLENFDSIGAYRTMDNGAPVDASGTYPGGAAFSSATELSRMIAQDPRYPTCVTKNILTYGVGRSFASSESLTYADALSKRAMAAGAGKWRSWVSMVAASDAFRTNRPDSP
jgi:hypothetical protein